MSYKDSQQFIWISNIGFETDIRFLKIFICVWCKPVFLNPASFLSFSLCIFFFLTKQIRYFFWCQWIIKYKRIKSNLFSILIVLYFGLSINFAVSFMTSKISLAKYFKRLYVTRLLLVSAIWKISEDSTDSADSFISIAHF